MSGNSPSAAVYLKVSPEGEGFIPSHRETVMVSTLSVGRVGPGELLELAGAAKRIYEKRTSPDERKAKGQIFTPPEVCQFMASLFSTIPREFVLLDPGAGVGSLAASICARFLSFDKARYLEVHAVESDNQLIELLDEVLQHCQTALRRAGHSMEYQIHEHDFVLFNADVAGTTRRLFSTGMGLEFDAIIMNPPYFKLNKNSQHGLAMESLIHGQPNIYALFLAISADLLRAGGNYAQKLL